MSRDHFCLLAPLYNHYIYINIQLYNFNVIGTLAICAWFAGLTLFSSLSLFRVHPSITSTINISPSFQVLVSAILVNISPSLQVLVSAILVNISPSLQVLLSAILVNISPSLQVLVSAILVNISPSLQVLLSAILVNISPSLLYYNLGFVVIHLKVT